MSNTFLKLIAELMHERVMVEDMDMCEAAVLVAAEVSKVFKAEEKLTVSPSECLLVWEVSQGK